MGTFRDLRELRTKLKNDPNFGGEIELTSVNNYTKLNCTFKKKPDDLADKVLEYCDEIATLAPQKIDVKLIFGRQISFAPQSYVIPNAVKPETNAPGTSSGNSSAKPEAPVKQTPANATPKSTTGTSAKPKSKTPTKGSGKSRPATNK